MGFIGYSSFMKRLYIVLFLIIFVSGNCCSSDEYESPYSVSLSRMEREWLKREFPSESDETRISRLEEKVFGSIHDIDKESRYSQLRKAFDARKTMRTRRSMDYLYGSPTSIPMNVHDLLEN